LSVIARYMCPLNVWEKYCPKACPEANIAASPQGLMLLGQKRLCDPPGTEPGSSEYKTALCQQHTDGF
jgi:hypothetical protein